MRTFIIVSTNLLLLSGLCCLSVTCTKDDAIDVNLIEAGNENEVYGKTEIKIKGSLAENRESDAINFGITPWDDPEKLKKMYAPLISYLSEQLKLRVRFVVAQDYQDLIHDIKKGIIHVAAFTPGAYADALESNAADMIYIATSQINGKDYYYGYIITKSNSTIQNLTQLKNKNFAFVEKGSSSGYKYPLVLFAKANIDPFKYCKKVFFLGSHSNVTRAILGGQIDAGATWDGHYDKVIKDNPGMLKIILKTGPIPYDAFVTANQKGRPFAKSIQKLLLAIKPNTRNQKKQLVLAKDKGFPYSGWVVRSPASYNIVRETTKIIKQKFK